METKVTLLSHTADPIGTLCKVWEASRTDAPLKLQTEAEEPERLDLFQKIIRSKIPVAEMLDFVFMLEGVSIAFREQMVRHRVGVKVGDRLGADLIPDLADSVWWSQSMRVLDCGRFYAEGKYEMPEGLTESTKRAYHSAMDFAQSAYNVLTSQGVPAETARLVLPLATQHRIVWKLNLGALMHVVGKRSCWILQLGFWGPVIEGMINELATKIHPVFRALVCPPCMDGDNFTGCIFELDNLKRERGEDPLPPCALFQARHRDRAKTEGWTPAQLAMMDKYRTFWGRDPLTGRTIR